MVFNTDKNLQETLATVLENESSHTYECSFVSCSNPVCRCGTIEVALRPLRDKNQNEQNLPSHRIDIDLSEKMLSSDPENKTHPKELAFANLFLSQLNEDDFEFLFKKHYAYKNKITEQAEIDQIDAFFDYEAVERDGEMYAYNDVLPYGDQMHVKVNREDYLIFDQYCLLPNCSCSNTIIDVVSKKDTGIENELCSLTVTYAKKHWEITEGMSSPINLGMIRSAIEEQNPGFYKNLHTRHKKLKSIYLNNRQKNHSNVPITKSQKVGRNDPCPCGSGKKYKKCCM